VLLFLWSPFMTSMAERERCYPFGDIARVHGMYVFVDGERRPKLKEVDRRTYAHNYLV
jgi:hypothetical protein